MPPEETSGQENADQGAVTQGNETQDGTGLPAESQEIVIQSMPAQGVPDLNLAGPGSGE